MRKILVLLTFIAFGITTGTAQNRPGKPAAGPVPKASFPPSTEITLKNGLRVVIVEDHKQPLVYLRTLIMSGTAADKDNIGAAAAVAALLEKGTKTRSADEIANKLDYYGAEIGAAASQDNINITTSCLKKDLSEVLSVYADVIRNPSFPTDELEKYRSQTLSGLKALKKSSSEPGRRLGRKLIYPDHPYGAFEVEETVEKLTQQAVTNYHKAAFNASNALIAVVGDVTVKEITPLLEKHFGTWENGSRPVVYFPPLPETRGMNFSVIDRPASVQSNIRLQRLGMSIADPDYDKAGFIASIFLGNGLIGFQNRLFLNIREKHGYTYTPGGSFIGMLDRGTLVAVAEVRNSVTDSALDQMLLEYRRLSSEKISADEMTFAKSLITGKYLMDLADPQSVSAKALNIIQYNLPKDYYATYPSRVEKFTADELLETARKIFPPNDLHVIITGDVSKIMPKLEKYGKFKMYDLDLKPIQKTAASYKPTTMTLQQVLEKMWSGVNRPAKEKIQSVKMQSNLMLEMESMKITGKMTEILQSPDMRYEMMELQGLPKIEKRVNDGKISEYQNGELTRSLEGEELRNELAFQRFKKDLYLGDNSYTKKLLGIAETQHGDCYVIEVSAQGTAPEQWFINEKTGYVVRKVQQSSEGDIIYDYYDFKMVNDVPFPFLTKVTGPVQMTVQYNDIQANINPDPKLFQMN